MINKPGVFLEVPEGFADEARSMSIKAACHRWSIGTTVAQRWRRESGLAIRRSSAFKPMPVDFPERAKDMMIKTICYTWSISADTACRWRKEAGFTKPIRRPQVAKERLQELIDTMTMAQASKAVGVSEPTLRDMYIQAGVTRRVVNIKRKHAPAPSRIAPPIHSARAQYAKDYIQRYEPIWRCREDGAYDYAGAWFRFRGKVLDGAAIVAKADEMKAIEARRLVA